MAIGSTKGKDAFANITRIIKLAHPENVHDIGSMNFEEAIAEARAGIGKDRAKLIARIKELRQSEIRRFVQLTTNVGLLRTPRDVQAARHALNLEKKTGDHSIEKARQSYSRALEVQEKEVMRQVHQSEWMMAKLDETADYLAHITSFRERIRKSEPFDQQAGLLAEIDGYSDLVRQVTSFDRQLQDMFRRSSHSAEELNRFKAQFTELGGRVFGRAKKVVEDALLDIGQTEIKEQLRSLSDETVATISNIDSKIIQVESLRGEAVRGLIKESCDRVLGSLQVKKAELAFEEMKKGSVSIDDLERLKGEVAGIVFHGPAIDELNRRRTKLITRIEEEIGLQAREDNDDDPYGNDEFESESKDISVPPADVRDAKALGKTKSGSFGSAESSEAEEVPDELDDEDGSLIAELISSWEQLKKNKLADNYLANIVLFRDELLSTGYATASSEDKRLQLLAEVNSNVVELQQTLAQLDELRSRMESSDNLDELLGQVGAVKNPHRDASIRKAKKYLENDISLLKIERDCLGLKSMTDLSAVDALYRRVTNIIDPRGSRDWESRRSALSRRIQDKRRELRFSKLSFNPAEDVVNNFMSSNTALPDVAADLRGAPILFWSVGDKPNIVEVRDAILEYFGNTAGTHTITSTNRSVLSILVELAYGYKDLSVEDTLPIGKDDAGTATTCKLVRKVELSDLTRGC